MQEDFDRYGETFSLHILDEIKSQEEARKEYDWMVEYQSFVPEYGYNYKDRKFTKKYTPDVIPYKAGLPKAKHKHRLDVEK